MRLGYAVGFIALAFIIAQTRGFHVAPSVYGAGMCTQYNATYIKCADGSIIPIGFSVYDSYQPAYGNFTALQADPQNISKPIDIFGNACTVESQSTTTCFVIVKPIPISSGNGTITKEIALKLVSASYPQRVFNYTIKITIRHYLTKNAVQTLALFNSTKSEYNTINIKYWYTCYSYSICDYKVSNTLSEAYKYISSASFQINSSNLDSAYYNLTIANTTLKQSSKEFGVFVNISNQILNNVVAADHLVKNASIYYFGNKALYTNCKYQANPYYDEYLSKTASSGMNYPVPNTLNSSIAYLNFSKHLVSYAQGIKASCTHVTSYSANPNKLLSLPSSTSVFYQSGPYLALGIIIVAIAAYARTRLISMREIKKIRDGA